MDDYVPMRLRPCYKEYLWGGDRLKKHYGKTDAPEITAESWELSAHPDGQSLVADGIWTGRSLLDLGRMDRTGFWGSRCHSEVFPLLVKLIDAKQDLSIQVHPSDETARVDLGERGKAEMWYVVECEPQAYLYFGFSKRVTREELLRRAEDGSICQVLNRVPVKRGDVFYILPGTIHAIGAGSVIAEIQQNSNTTFRVYDYGRRDASGHLRPLHLERAMQVINCEPVIPSECRANSSSHFPEYSVTEMFSCKYFRAHRLDVNSRARLCCNGESFQHLLCVDGSGVLVVRGCSYPLRRGSTYFMPARLGQYEVQGSCRVLLSRV